MTTRIYIEDITDPVTGQTVTFRAISEAELDQRINAYFGLGEDESPLASPEDD